MTKRVPWRRFIERHTVAWHRPKLLERPRFSLVMAVSGVPISGINFWAAYTRHGSAWMAWATAAATAGWALRWLPTLTRMKWGDRALARFSARGLTALAALLAGRKRPALRAEWRAHLAGESGHDQVTWRKVKEAGGFVASAIRCRCSDAADVAWAPADGVLKSRTLSNLFALIPAGLAALILFRHGGTIGLLGSAESVSAIYLMFYALVLAGRKYRNVKPPEPKARQVKE